MAEKQYVVFVLGSEYYGLDILKASRKLQDMKRLQEYPICLHTCKA